MDKRYEIKLDEKNKKLLVDTMDEFDKKQVLIEENHIITLARYQEMVIHLQNGYLSDKDIELLNAIIDADTKIMGKIFKLQMEHFEPYYEVLYDLGHKALEAQIQELKKEMLNIKEKQKCRE